MPLKKFKPTTPGLRGAARPSFDEITTKEPHKALLAPLKRSGGRNVRGKITVRHRDSRLEILVLALQGERPL